MNRKTSRFLDAVQRAYFWRCIGAAARHFPGTAVRRLAAASVLILATLPNAEATPRLASIVGQNCNLCHVNPTGGGLRSLYASQYLIPTKLAFRALPESADVSVHPQISDEVTIGTDFRFFHLNEEQRDSGNNFLTMQGSLYLGFEPDPRFTLYVHEEVGQGSAQAFELFAQGYILPWSGYVKAGRFVPSFGWKVPDHRSFVRREFVFLPSFPPHSDSGIEVGFAPPHATVELSLTNGDFRSPRDVDDLLAFTGRGSIRKSWSSLGLNACVGGSYHQRGEKRNGVWAGGPFTSFTWGRFTWVGELDWSHREIPAVGAVPASNQTALALSQEFSARILRGVDLVGSHDFFDPTKNRKTGSVERWGLGIDALLTHFVGIQAMTYLSIPDDGEEIALEYGFDDDRWQSALQIHFLY